MQAPETTYSRIGQTGPGTRSRLAVSNVAEISATHPIPFESGGTIFSYLNDKRYLPFLGGELKHFDRYGKLLLECRLTSTTHNACIITKKDYCAGDGFQNSDNQELDPLFLDWTRNVNLKNESVTEISKQIFESFFTYGNVPIELVRFEALGQRYFFIYVHNMLRWRLEKPGDDDIITHAITSHLFLRDGVILTDDELNKARRLPLYNPRNLDRENWQKSPDGSERTLIWYKNTVTSFDHYGLPSSVSSLIYQQNEYKGARYNLDNLENNMVVSAMLILQGNVNNAQATRIAKEAIKTHTGDGKRGRIMAIGSESGITGSDLHTFDTHKDGSYLDADETWTQKIILANQWDSVLAGLVSPSTLGKGSGYVTKIEEHINKKVIKPAQKDSVRAVWFHVFTILKEWLGFNIDENKIEIKNIVDISGLTDVDITPAVTINEVRDARGLQDLPPAIGDVLLGAAKGNQEGSNQDPQKGGSNNVSK